MLKALLIDNEDTIIDWNAEGFEDAATASSAQEALDYLKRHRVDLVVIDVKMPGMTGLDLLETVRAAHVSEAKFVILSGYGGFDYAQCALRFRGVDYSLKPVCEQSLVAVLRKISRISETEKPCEGTYGKRGADEPGRPTIRKENLNRLISAIRKNDRDEILVEADALFCEMRRGGLTCRDVDANFYYTRER